MWKKKERQDNIRIIHTMYMLAVNYSCDMSLTYLKAAFSTVIHK